MRYIMKRWGKAPDMWISIHPDSWEWKKSINIEELSQHAVVIFIVKSNAEREVQFQRAKDYVDYLNKLEEAKEEAVKNITITSAVAQRMTQP